MQYVDDLVRLAANGKNYWEYLTAWDWACGGYVDNIIVGPFFYEFIGCGTGCESIAEAYAGVGREQATTEDWYKVFHDHSSKCNSACAA